MKVLNKISVINNNKRHDLFFGIAQTEEEREKMFRLRHQIYVEKKKYILPELTTNGLELDEFDNPKNCTYFLAMNNNQVVGTIRVIKKNPLPLVENYVDFKDGYGISDEKKIEIGRFISIGSAENDFLPRHLIPFGLFYSISRFVSDNDIEMGYGAMKRYNLNKLRKIKFPLNKVTQYQTSLKKENKDPIKDYYFGQDPAIPLCFFKDEVNQYLDKIFNHSLAFKKTSEDEYIFRGNSLMLLSMVANRIFSLTRS